MLHLVSLESQEALLFLASIVPSCTEIARIDFDLGVLLSMTTT